jgi:hypothetical protein
LGVSWGRVFWIASRAEIRARERLFGRRRAKMRKSRGGGAMSGVINK